MKQAILSRLIVLVSLIFLSSCSGGSSKGGSRNATELSTRGAFSTGMVLEGQSNYYSFQGVESTTYQITLTSITGDADIAVFSSDELTDETAIVVSVNELPHPDDFVKFTAPNTQNYYIEVTGFVNSNYSIALSEVPNEEVGFNFGQNQVDFISVKGHELPDAQSIDINVTEPSLRLRDPVILSDSNQSWINFEIIDLYREETIDFNVISNTDPVGIYSTSLRVHADNNGVSAVSYPSVAVYKDIEVNYSLLNLIVDTEDVTYGERHEFQIESPPIPNSGIDISLLAPASMSLDADGTITWLPTGPMFDSRQSVSWTLRISRGVSTYDLTTTTLVSDSTDRRPLFRAPISTPQIPYNSDIADFDGDGRKELLLTDNKKQVFTLEYDNNTFQHDWSLPFSTVERGSVRTLTSADVNSDGNPDIIIGYSSTIVILDGVTKRQLTSFEDGYTIRREMIAANLTNNSSVTLVYLVPSDVAIPGETFVYSIVAYNLSDLSNPDLVWQSEPFIYNHDYGHDHTYLKIDNVDQDSNLEIISASGEIIDGESFLVQDTFPIIDGQPSVSHIATADLNSDGVKDVVICCAYVSGASSILGYSAVDGSIIWESGQNQITSGINVQAISVGNIDSSEEEELLVVMDGRLLVYAHNIDTGVYSLDWEHDHVSFAHTLLIENIDNDPELEIITLNEDAHIVHEISLSALTLQWELPIIDFKSSYSGGMWTEVVPNEPVAIFLNSDDENDSGGRSINLLGINAIGDMSFRSINPATSFYTARSRIAKTDYDNDGIEELFLSMPHAYDGFLSVMDFEADTIEWQSPTSIGGSSQVVKNADMNGDSFDDIVSIQDARIFYIYDVYNDTEIASFDIGIIFDFEIVETNSTDVFHIVFRERGLGLRIYEYRRSTNELTLLRSSTFEFGSGYNDFSGDLLVADINQDNNYEIILRNGPDFRIKDFDLNTLNEYTVETNWPSGRVYTENGSRFSKNLLITISSGSEKKCRCYPVESTLVRLIDGMSGKTIWESPSLIGSAQNDSLNVIDTDLDGIMDFYTLGTTEGMYIIK